MPSRTRNAGLAASTGLLLSHSVAAADFTPSNKVVVYWGQNSYGSASGDFAQQRLAAYCANTNIDIIPLAFMVKVTSGTGGVPVLNFANSGNACSGLFPGTNLLNCSASIGEDIKFCQEQYGKTVILSIGGATYQEGGFESEDAAVAAADMVWSLFGPERIASVPISTSSIISSTMSTFTSSFLTSLTTLTTSTSISPSLTTPSTSTTSSVFTDTTVFPSLAPTNTASDCSATSLPSASVICDNIVPVVIPTETPCTTQSNGHSVWGHLGWGDPSWNHPGRDPPRPNHRGHGNTGWNSTTPSCTTCTTGPLQLPAANGGVTFGTSCTTSTGPCLTESLSDAAAATPITSFTFDPLSTTSAISSPFTTGKLALGTTGTIPSMIPGNRGNMVAMAASQNRISNTTTTTSQSITPTPPPPPPPPSYSPLTAIITLPLASATSSPLKRRQTTPLLFRPFGSATIDGFDLDIETPTQNLLPFASRLRTLMDHETSKRYYLTAAPQCNYPDTAFNSLLTSATAPRLDALFIQFYNNACGLPSFPTTTTTASSPPSSTPTQQQESPFNFESWHAWARSTPVHPGVRLFLGIPGAPSAATSGYVSLERLEPVLRYIKRFDTFAGVMVWDASQAVANEGFLEGVMRGLDGGGGVGGGGGGDEGKEGVGNRGIVYRHPRQWKF